jgi:anti-anti-sigma factor
VSRKLEIEIETNLCGTEALSLALQMPASQLALADHVILSLARVEYVDHAGLAFLVRMYSQLRTRGKLLSLRHIPRNLSLLLRDVGLDELFPEVAELNTVAQRSTGFSIPARAGT